MLHAIQTGIVLGTIFAGGTLISNNEMSPGDLMSFLVASQTVQRYKMSRSDFYSTLFINKCICWEVTLFNVSGPWQVSPSSLDRLEKVIYSLYIILIVASLFYLKWLHLELSWYSYIYYRWWEEWALALGSLSTFLCSLPSFSLGEAVSPTILWWEELTSWTFHLGLNPIKFNYNYIQVHL